MIYLKYRAFYSAFSIYVFKKKKKKGQKGNKLVVYWMVIVYKKLHKCKILQEITWTLENSKNYKNWKKI